MTGYRRPILPELDYRDEHGEPIPYGSRWHGGSPPEDAYSRTSNLDRFEPLHSIATALIAWLQETFDVDILDDVEAASDMRLDPGEATRTVRLMPRCPDAAPLTFVLTAYPGTYLHAGVLHDFSFPVCACDACDEDVAGLAEELEWTVRMVVSGGYSEHVDSFSRWIEYRVEEPGVGMRSGRSRANDLPSERLRAAKKRLPKGGRWVPWPVQRRQRGGPGTFIARPRAPHPPTSSR
ncbi:DUF6226 family protein [Agromyces archimandritae]|uniref:Uncharacterized protein n=1 Tax=Agromyces archimandritae TaxID=2781962 RepID=A0A975INV5_9MICO|nr:DUF6226 family protein [Agromyces archimandritae]QTX04955.1 hypothetical protein G127AT_01495 [Agromyces archimandritae]